MEITFDRLCLADSKMIIRSEDPDSVSKDSEVPPQPKRYPNLRAGGLNLALALERYRHEQNVVVLGLVMGGIPVAHEVATHLKVPFDFIIVRRLLAPQGPGSQVCAAYVAGQPVLPGEILPLPEKPSAPIDYFIADALAQLAGRNEICRRGRPPMDLTGKIVLLIDCGSRTGMTMEAAVDALRSRNPQKIIAAMPIGSADSCNILSPKVDEFVCLAQPEPFGHVGMWYVDFSRPTDEQIHELLQA